MTTIIRRVNRPVQNRRERAIAMPMTFSPRPLLRLRPRPSRSFQALWLFLVCADCYLAIPVPRCLLGVAQPSCWSNIRCCVRVSCSDSVLALPAGARNAPRCPTMRLTSAPEAPHSSLALAFFLFFLLLFFSCPHCLPDLVRNDLMGLLFGRPSLLFQTDIAVIWAADSPFRFWL